MSLDGENSCLVVAIWLSSHQEHFVSSSRSGFRVTRGVKAVAKGSDILGIEHWDFWQAPRGAVRPTNLPIIEYWVMVLRNLELCILEG